MRINALRFIFLVAIILLLPGCAKYPGTTVVSGKQLVVTLTVAGTISPTDSLDASISRHYFVAIDNDSDPNTGPWAVVAPPFGGNGWVTSKDAVHSVGLTSFLEYDTENPDGYVYGVLSGSYFLNTTSPMVPLRTELLDGGSTLRVTIDLSQIATTNIALADIKQLNINFITTNQLAVNPSYTYPGRKWDSLGTSGQDYVTVDATQDRTYSDDDPQGDVSDPDMDIVSWSVEVQTVSSH